ncbi:hypothetical protein UFOVP1290_267 [uncultured Caudovirales phage]|uniref:Uncharacterized protein n=1 Tax=uncultured Caudovirales phage TaxID=2100421 RepID=A0A6J5RR28_9CAUD|nr:hypothetical protein UFOVP1290_267 [uncultured Caudovirales phage]
MKSSGKYSGSTSVSFEIERYRDNETGDLYMVDDNLPGTDEDGSVPEKYELCTFSLDIEGTAHSYPAKTHGDPEFCYPADSDCEITKVSGPEHRDWEAELSSNEIDHINDMLIDNIVNYEGDDYDDRDDDYDDRDYDNDDFDPYYD